MAQLSGGEPLSPKLLTRGAPTTFPFGLCNAAETFGRLVAQRTHPSSMNSEFVGMADYVSESFFNLLTEGSETLSGSDSSRGSHHPSRECFMAKKL